MLVKFRTITSYKTCNVKFYKKLQVKYRSKQTGSNSKQYDFKSKSELIKEMKVVTLKGVYTWDNKNVSNSADTDDLVVTVGICSMENNSVNDLEKSGFIRL